MVRFRLTSLLIIPLSTCLLTGAPETPYDHGNPSDDEQLMVEMINRARFDPPAEGQRYVDTTDPDVAGQINAWEVDIQAVAAEFATYPSRPPLAINASLMAVARNQSNHMIAIDLQTHDRPDSDTNPTAFRDSFNAEGYNANSWIAENVFANAASAWQAHAAFNVDWGGPPENKGIQDPPGHRINIMNYLPHDPWGTGYVILKEVGVAMVEELDGGTSVGPQVVSQEFGRTLTDSFLTGVVYDDSDGDGFYSPGEGISGVTVMPDSGDYYAITSASGGYTIPLFNSEAVYEITFSGGGVAPVTTDIQAYKDENYKIDLIDGIPVHYFYGHKDSRWRWERTDSGGTKEMVMGFISDGTWPWLYHHNSFRWAYVPGPIPSQDGFYTYFPGDPGRWMWSRDDLYGWHYDYLDQTWYDFTPE